MARAEERCCCYGRFRDRSVNPGARRAHMKFRQLLLQGLVLIQTACSGTSDGGTGGNTSVATGGASATGGYSGVGGREITIGSGGFISTSGGNTGAILCGKNSCSTGQYCCNPSCGICGPAGGLCPNIACSTGGATSANLTAGEACTQGSCAAGLLCCYPCGTAGCVNQCMQPGSNGQCPMYP